jgi:lysophospholipase L1-like esterase
MHSTPRPNPRLISMSSSRNENTFRKNGTADNSTSRTKLRPLHGKLLNLMEIRYWIIGLAAALLVLTNCSQAQQSFQLRDDDRIVFYGDSITEPRLYTAFVETYAVTRFPDLHVTFTDSAWGGDRVTGGRGGPIDLRLQRDVISQNPTVLAIMLGINDGRGIPYDPELFDTFATGYEHIVKTVRKALPGIRITLMQPSPYDEVTRPPAFEGGYNGVLLRYGAFVKELGQREGLKVADLNAPLVAVLQKADGIDHTLAQRIAGDGTHPGLPGHLILAESLLKAWNAPAIVSSVELDAARNRVVHVVNASVSGLRSIHGLSWVQKDEALPFPIDLSDPAMALAVRCSDVVQALDQQMLKVSGLPAMRYRLEIDGESVAFLDQEQLVEGVNLALLNTPMKQQAMRVHALTRKRNEVQFGRWRQVQMALQNDSLPHKQAALDALDNLEQYLLQEQRATAHPKARHYELVPE